MQGGRESLLRPVLRDQRRPQGREHLSWSSTDEEEELTVRKAKTALNRGNSVCKGTGASRGPDTCVSAITAVNACRGGREMGTNKAVKELTF